MDHGVGKGPQLGATLRRAEEAWIAADFPTAETALREIIELSLPGRRPQ
jgi:hypothetical protein